MKFRVYTSESAFSWTESSVSIDKPSNIRLMRDGAEAVVLANVDVEHLVILIFNQEILILVEGKDSDLS